MRVGKTIRKLPAYITPLRGEVRAQLLDEDGVPIAGQNWLLRGPLPSPWQAYQTAVAWDSTEHRWLVVWTENTFPTSGGPAGRVLARYVNFHAATPAERLGPEPDPDEPLITCEEGDQDRLESASMAAQEQSTNSSEKSDGVRANEYQVCKGIWLASSWYSNSSDRYRLHVYGDHARLSGDGAPAIGDPFQPGCSVYCPITEGFFYYSGRRIAPFQMLQPVRVSPFPTQSLRLIRGSQTVEPADFVLDYQVPQAFRSDTSVAVAISTDGIPVNTHGTPVPRNLALSIVDMISGGCPP